MMPFILAKRSIKVFLWVLTDDFQLPCSFIYNQVLEVFRVSTGYILGQYWIYSGSVLGIIWTSTGYIPRQYWIYSGPTLVIICTSAGYFLSVSTGYILDQCWLYSGGQYWLYSGLVQVIFWRPVHDPVMALVQHSTGAVLVQFRFDSSIPANLRNLYRF